MMGILFFLVFLCITGLLWAQILNRVFFVREKYLNIPLGFLASILLLGFVTSVFVVWYKLNLPVAIFIYGFLLALPLILKSSEKIEPPNEPTHEPLFGFFPKRKFLFFCFFTIAVLQVVILKLCQVDTPLTSPWQTIHPWYLYNFFLLTVLLGVLLFSKISYQTKFFLIIVFSVLLHLYLPLSHTLPWGGDVWRMIGVEQKLATGQAQLPLLPEALWNPYKYTYGAMWGLMAFLQKMLGISLVSLHRYFMAVVWGVMTPILFLQLGKLFFQDKRKALLFSAWSSVPFALQAIGSITVSVSLGFLTLLFALFLWFTFLQTNHTPQKKMALAFGILLFFGYALHALVFWYGVLISLFIKKMWKDNNGSLWSKWSKKEKIYCVSVCMGSILLFPFLDVLFGFSHFPTHFSLLSFLKNSIGQFAGWYFARPISPNEISSANILFNHIPQSGYVGNIFSAFRTPVLLLSVGLWCFVFRALFAIVKKQKILFSHMFGFLFLLVMGGYVIGWYILTGDRIFVRRLDSVFAFVFLVLTFFGIFQFKIFETFARISSKKQYTYFFLVLIFLSFTSTTIYATGPDVRVVSHDEYAAAEYIFDTDKKNSEPCVVSDTWVLLALEAVSSQKIVGGGFPIDANFGQEERVKIYTELLKNPDKRIIPEIQSVIKSPYCYVAISREALGPRGEEKMHDFLGDLVFKSGSVLVWKMELKNMTE